MKSYYKVFETNLPIPVRVNYSITNGNGTTMSMHNSKTIKLGLSNAKYGVPGKLNYFEVLYCFSGEFNYVTDAGEFEVTEGSCLLVGRQQVRYCNKNETRMHCVYTIGFDRELCKSLGVDDTITGLISPTDIITKTCMIDIIKEVDRQSNGWENRMLDIVKSMLFHINTTYKDYSRPVNDKNILPDEDMVKIDSYIRAHVSEKITLEDLANLVDLKSTQFNKRFKITTNYTPVEYINIVRCRAAREFILTTDFSLEEIISMCGYNDRSYFYKKYKEIYDTNAYDDMKTAPYR